MRADMRADPAAIDQSSTQARLDQVLLQKLLTKAADGRALCPNVTSPLNAIGAALDLADLTSDDCLVDLGCGEGSVLVQAAHTYGCKCIGYEVRLDCLRTTRRAAEAAGVDHLVEAVDIDMMSAVLESHLGWLEATVVYAYLMPHMTRQLERLLVRAVADGKVSAASAALGAVLGQCFCSSLASLWLVLMASSHRLLLACSPVAQRVVLYCQTGSRVRRPGAPEAGNRLGDMTPAASGMMGMIRLYCNEEVVARHERIRARAVAEKQRWAALRPAASPRGAMLAPVDGRRVLVTRG